MAVVFLIRNYGNTRSLPYKNQSLFLAKDGVIETSNKSLVKAFSRFPQIEVTEKSLAKGEAPEVTEASKLDSVIPEVRASIDFRKLTRPRLFQLAKKHNIKTDDRMTKGLLAKKLEAVRNEL